MDLLEDYRARGPGHDEMLQSTGPARAAWEELAARAHLGRAERLEAARSDVVALLQDQGVTSGDLDQEWALDPLPVLVEETQWAVLEDGLRQRAELLDQVLTDLYGDRTLLTSGLLPPEIILAHPGFVGAAQGMRNPCTHQLFHLATDLARNADGAWTVLADRTDVPAGLGYAMADRRVVSEAFAGPYRNSRTRRLGPFYQALRRSLAAVAPPAAGDRPRVAVLSTGTAGRSGAAFDHGYLSVLLGVPLVEGGDLAVEDGRVWVRGLGGREPVDVLLRGAPSWAVDPLDLDRTSTAGAAGLLHAARRGAVTVVNTLGSGLLESPALATYLPRLARALRDEELLVPSVVTYWCGERAMCSHVMANLGRLIVRPVAGVRPPVLGWELSLDERADLAAAIAARPAEWVGQEPVEASTSPSVVDGALVPRATSLRTFTLSRDGEYTVLAGALGHVSPVPQATVAGGPGAGAAKDVWVLAAEPLAVAGDTSARAELVPGRDSDGGISLRSAADLFRMGRHVERAEQSVRFLLAVADRWDDYHARPGARPEDPGGRALETLLTALHATTADGPLAALLTDPALEGSVAWTVAQLGRDAAGVRDNLSPDVWIALSSMNRALRRERDRRRNRESAEVGLAPALLTLLEGLLALQGIVGESLVRDVGWLLLDTGRRLERAREVVASLSGTLTEVRDPAVEELVAGSVLAAHESALTFRRRHPDGGLAGVLDLLLQDRRNPRALAFQLDRMREHFTALPPVAHGPETRDRLLAETADVTAELRRDRAVGEVVAGRRIYLAEALDAMASRLEELAVEIPRIHLSRPTVTGLGLRG
ncbi:circularly permuted type 2 ATP-grasp protein [Georgenia alba]|uniref:Circularly permuted type 2 ATP-grasp protein n=1 Tax=Georgenia alba TaxID=2233858 RepID=A0ABW2Q4Y9_9MICO